MATHPDKLVARVAEIHASTAEWDESLPGIGEAYKPLFENIQRHAAVGTTLIQRASHGKGCDTQVAELIEVFRAYDPLLRSLSIQCLRCAEISRRMHAKLETLSKPE